MKLVIFTNLREGKSGKFDPRLKSYGLGPYLNPCVPYGITLGVKFSKFRNFDITFEFLARNLVKMTSFNFLDNFDEKLWTWALFELQYPL